MLAAYHEEAIDYIESWGSFSHKRGMAAALRAAADQVVPEVNAPPQAWVESHAWWSAKDNVRDKLLFIAHELDNYQLTSEGD
jgi:hypothetical protein